MRLRTCRRMSTLGDHAPTLTEEAVGAYIEDWHRAEGRRRRTLIERAWDVPYNSASRLLNLRLSGPEISGLTAKRRRRRSRWLRISISLAPTRAASCSSSADLTTVTLATGMTRSGAASGIAGGGGGGGLCC